MRYAFSRIIIDPNKPVKQSGHLQQVNPISKVNDHLHARLFALEDDEKIFINISCDVLGFLYNYTTEILENIKDSFDKPVRLILSATHTHYSGDTTNTAYHEQLVAQLTQAIKELKFTTADLTYTYRKIPYQEVGTSRITNHQALVILNLVEIFDKDKLIANIINYNCHPTILSADETDFFSAEYVGYFLEKLTEKEGCFSTFLQGAAGDVSTRFTRSGQHYQDVIELATKLYEKVLELKQSKATHYSLDNFTIKEKVIETKCSFEDIDLSNLPANLSARELETIEFGKIVRSKLKEHPEKLQKEMILTRLTLGKLKIIFAPNELFSYYLSLVNDNNTILVCYSNGYSPYVTPINKTLLTYETFTDVLTKETKQQLVDTLIEFSQG